MAQSHQASTCARLVASAPALAAAGYSAEPEMLQMYRAMAEDSKMAPSGVASTGNLPMGLMAR